MSSPLFTGDSVSLGCSVMEDGSALEILSAKVTVFEPDNSEKLIVDAIAIIGGDNNNEATYLLPKNTTTRKGEHFAYFVCQFSGNRERTYEQSFYVELNPRFKEA